jgi:hypothetical protein
MAHRAAIYSVCVHPMRKPRELLRFNDFDGKGHSLADKLDGYFKAGLVGLGDSKSATCTSSSVVGDEVQMMATHGQWGVDANIRDKEGAMRLHQETDDSQEIRCGSLLRLKGSATTGWWAAHVNNGRSVKGLLHAPVIEAFRTEFPDLNLKITPCVSGAALTKAVDDGNIEAVKLVRLDKPKDRRDRITDQWVRKTQSARVEVGIRAGRGEHIKADDIKRFLHGDKKAFGDIVEFNGLDFDHAKVEVELPNGTTRTFNIETPDSGHAFTIDMDELTTGAPTDASIFAELGRAIDEMA